MAYRLTREEPLAAGIQRVFREELAAAISSLREAESEPDESPVRDAGVHNARKSIKKLRGMLRMVEPRLGALASQENTALQEAAHSLAGARDLAAAAEIIDLLASRYAGQPGVRGLPSLRRKLRGHTATAPSLDVQPAHRALIDVRSRVSEWPPVPDSFGSVADGLRKTYRRGRRALKAAEADPTQIAFHTLRKRVKDHWYQVRLLEDAWAGGQPREKELRELQECLGNEHDLSVLETLTQLTPVVRLLIDRARGDFRAHALKMANKLYADRPGEHVHQLRGLWEKWHRTQRLAHKGPGRVTARRRAQTLSAA